MSSIEAYPYLHSSCGINRWLIFKMPQALKKTVASGRQFLLIVKAFTFLLSCAIFIFSCTAEQQPKDTQKAKEFYAEGIALLDKRISVQQKDTLLAKELNKRAIEKFSASWSADNSFADAALFASECTMYGKDYEQCIYWTTNLMHSDTLFQNDSFSKERIAYCQQQLDHERQRAQ